MAKNLSNEFIEKYKRLEELLRNDETEPDSVYEFESKLADKESKKLQICRICRNYIQHNNDFFISPSQEMCDFLDENINYLESKYVRVKDKYVRTKALTFDMTVTEAASKLSQKKSMLVVVDKKNKVSGLFTYEVLRNAVVLGKQKVKLSSFKDNLDKNVKFISLNEMYEAVDGFMVVTSDGTKDGTYKGVVE